MSRRRRFVLDALAVALAAVALAVAVTSAAMWADGWVTDTEAAIEADQ